MYIFAIVLTVLVLLGLVLYAFIKNKKVDYTHYVQYVMEVKYNRELNKINKYARKNHALFSYQDVSLKYKYSECKESDLLSNIIQIQKLEYNLHQLYLFKKEKSKDKKIALVQGLNSLAPISCCSEDDKISLQLERNRLHVFEDVLDLAEVPIEFRRYFANLKGLLFDKKLFIELSDGLIVLDLNDLLNCQFVRHEFITIVYILKGKTNVEYDGSYSLEDVDFYQTKVKNTLSSSGMDIITKVKAWNCSIQISYQDQVSERSFLLLKRKHQDEFKTLISK